MSFPIWKFYSEHPDAVQVERAVEHPSLPGQWKIWYLDQAMEFKTTSWYEFEIPWEEDD